MIQNNTKRWINTRVEYQWSDELGELVQLSKEGYWYEGEITSLTNRTTSNRFFNSGNIDGTLFGDTNWSQYGSIKYDGGPETLTLTSGGSSAIHGKIVFVNGEHNNLAESMRIDSYGKVGIGTSVPKGTLNVSSTLDPDTDFSDGQYYQLHLHNQQDTTDMDCGIGFGISTSSEVLGANIVHERKGGNSFGDLAFGTKPSGGAVTERMRIDSTGKVGIGTTAPSAPLMIDAANVGWRGQFMLKDDTAGNNADAYMTFWSGDETGSGATGLLGQVGFMSGSTNSLSIRNYMQGYVLLNEGGGNVGIGTTAPSSLLHCSQSTTYNPTLTLDQTGGAGVHGGGIRMLSSGAAADADRLGHIQFDGQNDNSENIRYVEMHSYAVDVSDGTEDGKFVINTYVAGTYGERFSIVSGNVGIGVAAPASLLHVAGTMQVGVDDTGHNVKFFGAAAGAYMLWQEDENTLKIRGPAADHATNSVGRLTLQTAQVAVVDGDQIGSIDFQAPLESGGTDAILNGARIIAEAEDTFAADNNETALCFYTATSGQPTEKMRIMNSGNVGIGSAAPAYKLDVAGTFYSSGSSIEYKQEVEPYTPPEGALMSLKPVQYQYKDAWKDFGKRYAGNSSKQLGLVAEDVAKVLPELAVTKTENGKEVVRNVDYEKLTVLLVSEVQKLRTELDEIKNN